MPAAAVKQMTGMVIEWVRPSWFNLPIVGLPVQNFGMFIGLAFLAGGSVVEMETQRMKLGLDVAENALIAMVSGVLGSKLHCTFSEIISGSKVTPFFSGTGLSFQGGFLFATLCIIINVKFIAKKGVAKALDAGAPALVTGYAVGKLGCFTAGDGCYGIPTTHWAGMHFPNALVPTKGPVHSVPLYEFSFNTCLAIFLLVRARMSPKPVFNTFGVMLAGLGTLRFLMEYVRGHPIVAFGMTEYQFIAGGMVLFGISLALFTYTPLAVSLFGPAYVPGSEELEEMEVEMASSDKKSQKSPTKTKKAKAH